MAETGAIDQSAVKGEPGTGYENPDGKGPFACHNCEYFKAGSCGQKLMRARSQQPRTPDGRVKVDPNGCCEYVERLGEDDATAYQKARSKVASRGVTDPAELMRRSLMERNRNKGEDQ